MTVDRQKERDRSITPLLKARRTKRGTQLDDWRGELAKLANIDPEINAVRVFVHEILQEYTQATAGKRFYFTDCRREVCTFTKGTSLKDWHGTQLKQGRMTQENLQLFRRWIPHKITTLGSGFELWASTKCKLQWAVVTEYFKAASS